MRICYVITRGDEIGGAQVHVRDLAELAQKDGHEVLVIVGEHGLFTQQLQELNIKFKVIDSLQRKISPLKDIRALYSLYLEFKKFDPNVITLHSSKAGILGRLAAKFSKHNTIFTAHGWSFADGIEGRKKKFYIMVEKIFAKCTYKIITVSEQDKNLAIKYNVACDDQQIVIHNGIKPLTKCFEVMRESEKISLIMVARFSEQKDHETLLRALSNVKDMNWDLNLVGKGKLEYKYKKLVVELGIDKKVNFLGQRNDIAQLLAKSHVFILISHWEGYPLSILEAMRAGLPVIASNVGGNSEAVKNNVNGYLIEKEDIQGLTKSIRTLLESKDLREMFGNNNINEFREKHTVERMYQKTLSVYEACNKISH